MGESDELRADSDACKLHDKNHVVRQSRNSHANFGLIIQHSVAYTRHTEMYCKGFFHCDGSIGRHDCVTMSSSNLAFEPSGHHKFQSGTTNARPDE